MTSHLTVITRKGQVTIPADIRRSLDLHEGDAVAWVEEEGAIKLIPARFTLETAFGSVEPRRTPEDFDELLREAKAAKAAETVAELTEEPERPGA
ncbi:MAG TPA: AbrB/MazE/SpoVT family DNA-binding domain-containing protein [Thermomicrobiaceae bacterium]|nr:AbrB/MazE/SpoVT family DNA-binding domain-containing protein [Thermomicrobiaceae bacterium]